MVVSNLKRFTFWIINWVLKNYLFIVSEMHWLDVQWLVFMLKYTSPYGTYFTTLNIILMADNRHVVKNCLSISLSFSLSLSLFSSLWKKFHYKFFFGKMLIFPKIRKTWYLRYLLELYYSMSYSMYLISKRALWAHVILISIGPFAKGHFVPFTGQPIPFQAECVFFFFKYVLKINGLLKPHA